MKKEVFQQSDPKESPNPTTFSNMRSFDYLSGNSPKRAQSDFDSNGNSQLTDKSKPCVSEFKGISVLT